MRCRDNFYSFVVEKLSGMKLMKVSELLDYVKDRAGFEEVLRALDVPAFAIKSPIAIEKIGRRQGLALDELDFLKQHTTRQTKIPLPGPYLLTRSSWFEGLSDKAYPTRRSCRKTSSSSCARRSSPFGTVGWTSSSSMNRRCPR